jgi:SulP family sulfate permease
VLIYYLIPLLTKAIPSALAALIIGALTSYFLGWVPIIGEFHLNSKFTDWNPIQYYTRSIHLNSRSAAVLAVLGSDSLLTSVIADNMKNTA